jgi:hypothetical protein
MKRQLCVDGRSLIIIIHIGTAPDDRNSAESRLALFTKNWELETVFFAFIYFLFFFLLNSAAGCLRESLIVLIIVYFYRANVC